MGGNLNYSNGPLALTAFYERVRIANPSSTYYDDGAKRSSWMLGGSYDLKAAKLFATYGQSKLHDSSNFTRKTTSVGASVPVGAGQVMLAYAHTKENALDRKRQTASVGYLYPLSKRTELYANAMHDRITRTSSGNSYGLGIRHSF